jgi:hypothetical protein
MLDRNNPSINYESLAQRILSESKYASVSESDKLMRGILRENKRYVTLLKQGKESLLSARRAHRVVSPLPSLCNPILRDQGAVNRALFQTIESLFEALSLQEALNASLIEELRSLKKSREA